MKIKMMNSLYDVIAFTDNNEAVYGTNFCGKAVISPYMIETYKPDVIIICSSYYKEITEQLIYQCNIDQDRIVTYNELEKKICDKIIRKYEPENNIEIQQVLEVLKKGKLNVLGSYIPEDNVFSDVYRDTENDPYILFYGKKMYYPPDFRFMTVNGKEKVWNIMCEQDKNSPHLYLKNNDTIKDGSVIVDAGVCEGNFALKYIDKAKRIYLIESDPKWMEALKKTFAPYEDKVILCNKFLSRFDNENMIRLDSLISEKVDFIKMDIEGAEISALLGGTDLLKSSNAVCSICCYHKQYDEKYIRFILESCGYHTETSSGYMCFHYDDDFGQTLDLRRGVVYACK